MVTMADERHVARSFEEVLENKPAYGRDFQTLLSNFIIFASCFDGVSPLKFRGSSYNEVQYFMPVFSRCSSI